MKKRYLGFIVLLALLMCTSCGKSLEEQVAEQLELGNRYLEEMDYEQAIVAFNKVIEIDAKQVQAYIGGAEAYAAAANYDEALDLLDTGMENTQDREIQEKIGEICYEAAQTYMAENDYESAEEFINRGLAVDSYEKLKSTEKEIQIRRNLLVAEELFSENNLDQVYELFQGEEWNSLLQQQKDLDESIKLLNGDKGIGIYPVDFEFYRNYMIYYGDYQDGLRHGNGLWIGCSDENTYLAIGSWANDKPNGEYEVRISSNTTDTTYRTIVTKGTVVDGLWHGAAHWITEHWDGSAEDFPVSFTHGKWDIMEILEDEDGLHYKVSEVIGDEETSYLSIYDPDEVRGIVGFFEMAQNTEADGETFENAAELTGTEFYSSDELVRMAFDYRARHGLYECQYISVDSEDENTVVLHCFDIIIDDPETGEGHTATSDWYTIDRYTGMGYDLFDEEIDLNN